MGMLDKIIKGKTPQAPRIIVYGEAGVGKSMFAAGAPSPIFIDLENGLNSLEVEKFPVARTIAEAGENLKSIAEDDHPYLTVVIDSADWLERLIQEDVCAKAGAKTMDEACGGYGKAYAVALNTWKRIVGLMDKCRDRGIIVIVIAHSKIEKIEDPIHGTFDRYSPKLHKLSAALLCESADIIGLATRRMTTAKDESGNGERMMAKAVGKDGGERILRMTPGPGAVAKNRHGIAGDIALDFNTLLGAIQ